MESKPSSFEMAIASSMVVNWRCRETMPIPSFAGEAAGRGAWAAAAGPANVAALARGAAATSFRTSRRETAFGHTSSPFEGRR